MPPPHPKLKILHLLSQRPDSTGSGIYLQAMVREAANMDYARPTKQTFEKTATAA